MRLLRFGRSARCRTMADRSNPCSIPAAANSTNENPVRDLQSVGRCDPIDRFAGPSDRELPRRPDHGGLRTGRRGGVRPHAEPSATIILAKQPFGRHWLPLWAATATTLWDLVVDIRGSALSWLVPTRRRAVFRRSAGPRSSSLPRSWDCSPPLPVAWIVEAGPRECRRVAAGGQARHRARPHRQLGAENLAG